MQKSYLEAIQKLLQGIYKLLKRYAEKLSGSYPEVTARYLQAT
jgi:hypothetical protein